MNSKGSRLAYKHDSILRELTTKNTWKTQDMAKYILRKWWLALISNLVLSDLGMPTALEKLQNTGHVLCLPKSGFPAVAPLSSSNTRALGLLQDYEEFRMYLRHNLTAAGLKS